MGHRHTTSTPLGIAQRDQDRAVARDELDAAHHAHQHDLHTRDAWLAGARWAINHVHRLCHQDATPSQRGDAVHLRMVSLEELLDELTS